MFLPMEKMSYWPNILHTFHSSKQPISHSFFAAQNIDIFAILLIC